MNGCFEDILLQDEKILWAGQPARTLFVLSDLLLVPFCLVWGGFAFFWEYAALVHGTGGGVASWMFLLFGIPFVFAGIYLIIGRFFVRVRRNRQTFYAMTSLRAIVSHGVLVRKVESVFHAHVSSVKMNVQSNGIGTLTFNMAAGKMSGLSRANGMLENAGLGLLSGGCQCVAFRRISDAYAVYGLIMSLRVP